MPIAQSRTYTTKGQEKLSDNMRQFNRSNKSSKDQTNPAISKPSIPMLSTENSATLSINVNKGATTTEVSKVGRKLTLRRREDALVVESGTMHMTNVLPRMPLVTIASEKGTIVLCAMLR